MNYNTNGKKVSRPNLLHRHSHEFDKIIKRLSQRIRYPDPRSEPRISRIQSRSRVLYKRLVLWDLVNVQARSQNFEKRLLASSSLSVRPKGTRLPPGICPWNLKLQYFSKICKENLSFIKIWHEFGLLYMTNYAHLLWWFAQFLLEWEIFQTKAVEKIKTHILFSVTFFFFRKIVPFVK